MDKYFGHPVHMKLLKLIWIIEIRNIMKILREEIIGPLKNSKLIKDLICDYDQNFDHFDIPNNFTVDIVKFASNDDLWKNLSLESNLNLLDFLDFMSVDDTYI